MLTIIVARNQRGVIGKDGWMPWHVPGDLQFFKAMTLHHQVVFGRVTFNGFKKPLPHRDTFVVTTRTDLDARTDIQVIHDFIQFCQAHQADEAEIFIAGGAAIYAQALPYVTRMLISEIDNDRDGDTFFPDVESDDFHQRVFFSGDGFKVIEYKRKEQAKESTK